MIKDKRHPELARVGCYFYTSFKSGFEFFDKQLIKNGDVFIYKDGILWRV